MLAFIEIMFVVVIAVILLAVMYVIALIDMED
jgi:hypothetical protein